MYAFRTRVRNGSRAESCFELEEEFLAKKCSSANICGMFRDTDFLKSVPNIRGTVLTPTFPTQKATPTARARRKAGGSTG